MSPLAAFLLGFLSAFGVSLALVLLLALIAPPHE